MYTSILNFIYFGATILSVAPIFLMTSFAYGEDINFASCERALTAVEYLADNETSNPDANKIIAFLDHTISDTNSTDSYSKFISQDLGFRTLALAKRFKSSWFSNTFKIKKLHNKKISNEALAAYAVELSGYLIAVKAVRLRWLTLNGAFNPANYSQELVDFIGRIEQVTYQVVGVLDPSAIERKGLLRFFKKDLIAVPLLTTLGLSNPQVPLFAPSQRRAIAYLDGQNLNSLELARNPQLYSRAALHWMISRAFISLRVGLLATAVITIYDHTKQVETMANVIMDSDFRKNIAQSLKKSEDPIADMEEVIRMDQEDAEFYEQELSRTTDKIKRANLQHRLDLAKKAVSRNTKELLKFKMAKLNSITQTTPAATASERRW